MAHLHPARPDRQKQRATQGCRRPLPYERPGRRGLRRRLQRTDRGQAIRHHHTKLHQRGQDSLTADTNVTLTIDPGVIVYGENGADPAWLAVNRGNKISATGTASAADHLHQPSRTSRAPTTDTSQGQWGGVVLLGRGMITDCTAGGSTASGTCERDTEGAANPAIFGGADNTYNAGTMKYVQIRYSGYSLSPGNELQSLTTGGIGSGTTLDYFQSVNSSDDGAEFFGGAVNFKHYIAVNADDDSLDIDTGLQGNFQYVILAPARRRRRCLHGDRLQRQRIRHPAPEVHDRQLHGDPAQTATTSNSDLASILIRGNSDVNLVNGIVYNPEQRVHPRERFGHHARLRSPQTRW